MKKLTLIISLIFLLFIFSCNELSNEVSFSNQIFIDDGVLNIGNIFYSIYMDNPLETPGIAPLQSGLIGSSENAPLDFNSPMLTEGDTFYVVVYLDADNNQEWTFVNDIPVEPFGGYGFHSSTPALIPLIVTSETTTLPNFTIYHPGDVLSNHITFPVEGTISLDNDIQNNAILQVYLTTEEYYWGDTSLVWADSLHISAYSDSITYALRSSYYYLDAQIVAFIDEDSSGAPCFDNRSGKKLYLEPFGGYGLDFLADDKSAESIRIGTDSTELNFHIYSQYNMADHAGLAFISGSLTYPTQTPEGNLYIFLLDSIASLSNLTNLHVYDYLKTAPGDRYTLPPVEKGKTYYLCAFLDVNSNDSLDVDLLGLSMEPIGAYGLHPEFYDFEMDGFTVNMHLNNLNISILNVDSLYQQGSAIVGGTITLDDSVTADSGYACVFLNDPLTASTLLYMEIPVYYSGNTANFQFMPLWAINQTYYFGAYIDNNGNHVLDRDTSLLPLEPFGGYGASRDNPAIQPYEFTYPGPVSNLEMTILPPEAFSGK